MVVAAVVEDHIHHDLQTFGMRLVGEFPVFLVGAETWVHAVVVGSGIAMISAVAVLVGRVVLQDRSEPESSHAEVCEIVEMLSDALEVAAVSQTGLTAVVDIVLHPFDLVVVEAPIGKAVGHEHIEHVSIAEPTTLLT